MSILTSMITSTILNSLFSRSKSNRTEPNDFKPLDDKLVTKELPTRLDRTVTPKEQFLGNIGDDVVNESTSMSSLYSSLSDNSKAQVNASYEVYNALEDRMSNMNKRMDVLNENLGTVMEGVKSYGQLSSAVSSKGGFLSKVGSGVVNLLKNIGTTLLTIPMLIGSGLSETVNRILGDTSKDPNSSDPGESVKDPEVAKNAQEAIADAQKTREEAQNALDANKEEMDRLTKENENLSKLLESETDEETRSKWQSQIEKNQTQFESLTFQNKAFQEVVDTSTNKEGLAKGSWEARSIEANLTEANKKYDFGKRGLTPKYKFGPLKFSYKTVDRAKKSLTDEDYEQLNDVLDFIKKDKTLGNEDLASFAKSYFKDPVSLEVVKQFRNLDKIDENTDYELIKFARDISDNLDSLYQETKGRSIGINANTGYNNDDIAERIYRAVTGDKTGKYSRDKVDQIYTVFNDMATNEISVTNKETGEEVDPYDFIAEVSRDPTKFQNYSYYHNTAKSDIPLEHLLQSVNASTIINWADKSKEGAFVTDLSTGEVFDSSDWATNSNKEFDSKYSAYDLVTGGLDNLAFTKGKEGVEGDGLRGSELAVLSSKNSDIKSMMDALGGNYDEVTDQLYELARQNQEFHSLYINGMQEPILIIRMLTQLLANQGVGNTNLIVNNSVSSYDTDR